MSGGILFKGSGRGWFGSAGHLCRLPIDGRSRALFPEWGPNLTSPSIARRQRFAVPGTVRTCAPWQRKRPDVPVAPAPTARTPPLTRVPGDYDGDDAFVAESAWEALAPGFSTRSSVTAMIVELADDDDDVAVSGDRAANIVGELLAHRERQLQQSTDRDPTDDVRVATAFDVLEQSGILARMNLGGDQGEGSHDARELATTVGARGFVYFHEQDAARLAYPGAILYLGWDAVDTTREEFDEAAIRIGHEIQDAMEGQGLTVVWDGTIDHRPAVVRLDWRRPLPAD